MRNVQGFSTDFAEFLACRLEVAMDYSGLVADHEAIDQVVQRLLRMIRAGDARPTVAARILETLAEMIRDHLAVEDPIIYATVAATSGARHEPIAKASVGELEMLKEDWVQYLYRWDVERIAADWPAFSADTGAILGRVSDRVSRETAILYSLAVHYNVIAAN
jgi:hypothetical protein